MLRASGSKTWAGGQKKSLSIPLALTSPQDFPQRISSWESGNSWEGAAVDARTSHPFPGVPDPHILFSGKQGRGGRRGSHWHSQETLTWTETSARPTSLSAQHVTFFLLRSLVTLARVSPKDGRLPDCWVREKRGKSRRASAGFGLEAAGQGAGGAELMSLGNPSDSRWKREGGTGMEEVWERIWQRMALLQGLFTPSPGSLIQ